MNIKLPEINTDNINIRVNNLEFSIEKYNKYKYYNLPLLTYVNVNNIDSQIWVPERFDRTLKSFIKNNNCYPIEIFNKGKSHNMFNIILNKYGIEQGNHRNEGAKKCKYSHIPAWIHFRFRIRSNPKNNKDEQYLNIKINKINKILKSCISEKNKLIKIKIMELEEHKKVLIENINYLMDKKIKYNDFSECYEYIKFLEIFVLDLEKEIISYIFQ
jgi:hypothetical protein